MAELGVVIKPDFADTDVAWVAGHIAGLERDGLLVQNDEGQRLVAEEALPYDGVVAESTRRYRLPD